MENEIKTDLLMNGDRYKRDSIAYQNLRKKLIRLFSVEEMLKELKRRKVIKINWNTKNKTYDFKKESHKTTQKATKTNEETNG